MSAKGFDPTEHTGLVYTFVDELLNKSPSFVYLKDELVGSCFVALTRASKKYDPDKGAVSTFCWYYFRTATRECIWKMSSPVRCPEKGELIPGCSMDNIEARDMFEYKVRGLDSMLPIDATIPGDVQKMVRTLPTKLYKVLTMSYGILGEEKHTYQEIGNLMGLTRQRIEQLHKEAILKLKKDHVLRR